MKTQTYLHIADACHEDWNQMTKVEQGKFCGSCCKTVTDFSMMSDKEILAVLSKASANTCGRFTKHQLERPLHGEVPVHSKPYKFFLSAIIPTFLLANLGMAQNASSTQKGKVEARNITMGKVARKVECKVGETPQSKVDSSVLKIDTVLQPINIITSTQKIEGDVPAVNTDNLMMGGIQIFEPVSFVDTVKTYVRKAFNQNGFKIIGNPAAAGTYVNLQFKNEGSYTIQLLDASGKLVLNDKVSVTGKNASAKVTLPGNFIPGIYFVKATDDKKQCFTDKVNIY